MSKSNQVTESVTIIAVDGDRATVECVTKSACSSCAKSSECGNSALAKAFPSRTHHFQVQLKQTQQVGDQIDLAMPANSLLKSSLLVYLFPMLLLMLITGVAQFCIQTWQLPEWLLIIAFGFSLLLALRLIPKLQTRLFSNADYQPEHLSKPD